MNNEIKIQDYLSIGYIYLLLLGILRDAIYYYFLDVNILTYSSISDILLSPIVYLGENPIVLLILLIFTYLILGERSIHEKYRDKKWYRKLVNVQKRDEALAKASDFQGKLMLLLFAVGAFFIGTGLGEGLSTADKLQEHRLEMRDMVAFTNEQESAVHVLGQTSEYLLYVKDTSQTVVTITPITGNIKRIEVGRYRSDK